MSKQKKQQLSTFDEFMFGRVRGASQYEHDKIGTKGFSGSSVINGDAKRYIIKDFSNTSIQLYTDSNSNGEFESVAQCSMTDFKRMLLNSPNIPTQVFTVLELIRGSFCVIAPFIVKKIENRNMPFYINENKKLIPLSKCGLSLGNAYELYRKLNLVPKEQTERSEPSEPIDNSIRTSSQEQTDIKQVKHPDPINSRESIRTETGQLITNEIDTRGIPQQAIHPILK